tara:strand:- start:431 stop:682 length:252 start_codon:yes stop_codon:yes gene_type:complete
MSLFATSQQHSAYLLSRPTKICESKRTITMLREEMVESLSGYRAVRINRVAFYCSGIIYYIAITDLRTEPVVAKTIICRRERK